MDVDPDRRPDRHILLELGFVVSRAGDEIHGHAEVVPPLWVPGTSCLRTSILAMWVDQVAGIATIDVLGPRVPVTLELDVHLYENAPAGGTVRAIARVLKAGRSVVVCGVDLVDQHGSPVALGTASFMAAPDPNAVLPSNISLDTPPAPLRRLDMPIAERARCRQQAPGTAVLPRSEDGLNASGTINGGLIALAVEEAALSLTPGTTLSSMALRYLRPVRTGPAIATAEVWAGLGRVEVRDGARDDHRAAVTATTRTFARATAGGDRGSAPRTA